MTKQRLLAIAFCYGYKNHEEEDDLFRFIWHTVILLFFEWLCNADYGMLISDGSKIGIIIPKLIPPEFEEKTLITRLKSALEARVHYLIQRYICEFCFMNKIVLPNLFTSCVCSYEWETPLH
jgi:hypothetical protein